MNCPWCDFAGGPRALHAHFGEVHRERVTFEERVGRTFYAVVCPVCGADYAHEIKPRGRDAGFVDEFADQIRLVAFDMLVNHLLVEHDPETASVAAAADGGGGGTGAGGAPAVGPDAGRADRAPAAPAPAWLVEARRRAGGDAPPDAPGDAACPPEAP